MMAEDQDDSLGTNLATSYPQAPQIFVLNGDPMKLYVSFQVPTRKTFIEMVELTRPKRRGGKIALSEIGSDVRIGDHMKQTCAGMISYRWIEECCRAGELVDTESHKIHRLGGRTIGSHRTARRNEFSAADDRLLIDFVKKHAAVNGAISGNKIYDSLAVVHPQHTSQSWRNRWVKVLSKRPDVSAVVDIVAGTDVGSSPKRRGFGFTRELDNILLRAIEQPGVDTEDDEFWERLALTHVSMEIPAEQWRQRYFSRLKAERDRANASAHTDRDDTGSQPFGRQSTPIKRTAPDSESMTVSKKMRTKEPPKPVPPTPQIPLSSTSRKHIPKSTPPPSKAIPTSEITTPASLLRHSIINTRRSSSPSTLSYRETRPNPLSRVKSSSMTSHRDHTEPTSHLRTSTPSHTIPPQNIIYHNPESRTTVWRSAPIPAPRTPNTMDDDDAIVHQQILRQSTGRTNRIRVSMGDINIEIESDSSPKIVHDTPHRFPGSSPPRSDGTFTRRTIGREIPSTPGTSPIKFRAEDLRDEEEDIHDGFTQRLDREHEDDAMRDEEMVEIEEMDEEERIEGSPRGIGAFGPDTQALFEGDDVDFVVPNLEITPSPRKLDKTLSSPSRFLANTNEWVSKKANRYNVDQEVLWWILERTTGRPKLAVKTLKSFLKTNALPDLEGVWTDEDDRLVLQRDARIMAELDRKHGWNASAERLKFLDVLRSTSAELRRKRKGEVKR